MKTNWKAIILVGVLSSATTIAGFRLLNSGVNGDVIFKEAAPESMVKLTSLPSGVPGDFTVAAEVTTPTVVHIRSVVESQPRSRGRSSEMDFFRDFFGEGFGGFGNSGPQRQEGTGSGVIISPDGYIVTNNHVVEGATELEVTLHNKSKVKATIVGADPSTDIAVIKIDKGNLPAVTFGNSDALKVGEWVVAVGNPFNLESTVTAGIVSAKGRGLGIIGSQNRQQRYRRDGSQEQPQASDAIESFIQTDAVVNPGNSGGALVNLKGELIGINTAIASPTGSYAGYAFAVPSSIVKKVSADLIKYGNVQRGFLGVSLTDLDSKKAEELGVKITDGVYVADLPESSAAKDAGIKKGDVITRVDGIPVTSVPELQQAIGIHRPGDKVKVTVNREGKDRDFSVSLRNQAGNTDIVKATEKPMNLASLGATFGSLNEKEAQRLARYNISGGVKITSIQGGKLGRSVDEGFVITKVNKKPVKSIKELETSLAGKEGSFVEFEGVYLEAPAEPFSVGFVL